MDEMQSLELEHKLAMEQAIDFNMRRERRYLRNANPNLQTRPESLAQLFSVAASLPRDQAVEYLRKNRHPAILQVGRYILDPSIQFRVSANCLYTSAQMPQQSLSLYQEVRRLYLFCNDPSRLSPIQNDPEKMQGRFEDMLAGLLADEAGLLVQIVQKQLPFDPTILLEVYPELQPDSEAAVKEKSDAPRRNATRFATDNLTKTVGEAQARIKEIDARLRDNRLEHDKLTEMREREFHRIRRAQLMVGDLT
jgi:hypothetical protein